MRSQVRQVRNEKEQEHRVTSLIRNRTPLGPYRRPVP